MTIATKVAAALVEPALGCQGPHQAPQSMSSVLSLAPIAGLGDPAPSHANQVVSLLAGLTDHHIDALGPADRRLLRDQLERVHRMVAGATIMSDARKATAPKGGEPKRSKAAFLDELRDGRGRD